MAGDTKLKHFDHAVESFMGTTVLVVGDIMVDRYLTGRVRRISPEAPVPVVEVESESLRLGGAANVANNIRTLGGRPLLCGVIGRDNEGHWVGEEMKRLGMKTGGLISDPKLPTTVKTRIVAHHQQVVRYDREQRGALSARTRDSLGRRIAKMWQETRGAVVSDYAKGVVDQGMMDHLRRLMKEREDLPVTVDPKARNFGIYRSVSVLTPNLGEAMAAAFPNGGHGSIEEAGRKILSQTGVGAVLITRGEEGMTLFERRRNAFHIPTTARDVFDVTGAGDTVIATLSLALSSGMSTRDAARIANSAAGAVVGEFGTVAVDRTGLLQGLERCRKEGQEPRRP